MKIGNMYLASRDIPKAIVFVLGLISVLLINYSWIKATVYGLLVVSVIVWAASIRLRRRTSQRVFKYMLVGVLVFTIFFATSEVYTLRTVGYPPTFNPSQPNTTISRSTILDTSVVELIQGIQNTPAFRLLSLEYPGENLLKQIELTTLSPGINGGHILVRYHHSTTIDFYFSSHQGRPYEVRVLPWNIEFPAQVQPQTINKSLQQIDDLGLQWFYDRTVEEHQNKTGTTPEITDIQVSIKLNFYTPDQGLTLSMTCFYESTEPKLTAFTSNFQSNGTLL